MGSGSRWPGGRAHLAENDQVAQHPPDDKEREDEEEKPEPGPEVTPAAPADRPGKVAEAQAPILLATAMAIIASLAQVGWLLARGRRVEPMLWVSLGVIVVFGGVNYRIIE